MKFNAFKAFSKPNTADKPVQKPIEEPVKKDIESTDVLYQKVTDRFDEYKKNGVEITDKMAADVIKEIFGLTPAQFFNEQIKDPKTRVIHKKIADKIEHIMLQKSIETNSVLSFLREKMFKTKFNRAVVLTIILFFKFHPSLGANHSDKEMLAKAKIETSTEKKTNGTDGGDGDKDTYKATKSDLKTMEGENHDITKEVSTINMTNSFELDNATISNENAAHIIADLNIIIDQVHHDNFKDFMAQKKTLSASSSQEPTKYGAKDKNAAPTLENNKGLTEDRFAEGEKILKSALENHDYSKSGLSPSEVQQLKNIHFDKEVPEKGYTKITELNKINPITGEKYTDKDVEEMKKSDPNLYNKLSEECRYVKASFTVETVTQPEVFKLAGYSEWSTYFDDSPSMNKIKEFLGNEFIKASKNTVDAEKPGKIFLFSNGIDVSKEVKNPAEAAKVFKTMKANGNEAEKIFSSLIAGLSKTIDSDSKKYKPGEPIPKRLALAFTDEGFQDVNKLDQAVAAADKANTDVKIIVHGKTFDIHDIKGRVDRSILEVINKQKQGDEQKLADYTHKLNTLVEKAIKDIGVKGLKKAMPKSNFETEEQVRPILMDLHSNVEAENLNTFLGGEKVKLMKDLLYSIRTTKGDVRHMQQELAHYNDKNVERENFTDITHPHTVDEFKAYNTRMQIKNITDSDGNRIELPISETSEDYGAGRTTSHVFPKFINL